MKTGKAQAIWVRAPGHPPYVALIAQSVEQRTENPRVGGSIPPQGTITIGRLAQLGEHLPYKQGVTGSSPVTTTI